MEQRQARRSESAPEAPRDLGYSHPLHLTHRTRELALFDLAIDSKLRACDLVKLRVSNVAHSDRGASRATVMQQKTRRPVQFEITESTREAVDAWIAKAGLGYENFLFPSWLHDSPHLSTRQYARIVDRWVRQLDLDPAAYGTHTMRRTKAPLIYRRTHNLHVRCSCCSATASSRAPCATWASKSTTRWRWPSRPKLEVSSGAAAEGNDRGS